MIQRPLSKQLTTLAQSDWSFASEDTRYLTHPIHRYSSKFVPQIPRRLIEQLTGAGSYVLDNFVGSGTTLVEANLLKRHCVGVDLNPVACAIAKAKITPVNPSILENTLRTWKERLG